MAFEELRIDELLVLLEERSKKARKDRIETCLPSQSGKARWHYTRMEDILAEIKLRIDEAEEEHKHANPK